jgi:hypothetical protein
LGRKPGGEAGVFSPPGNLQEMVDQEGFGTNRFLERIIRERKQQKNKEGKPVTPFFLERMR